MYTRQARDELGALSKEIFGTTSKWKKMIELGVVEPVLEDVTRLNPDGTKETVKVQKMHEGPNGGQVGLSQLKRYTAESVREFLLDIKQKRTDYINNLIKAQQEKKAQDAAQAALKDASGTSA